MTMTEDYILDKLQKAIDDPDKWTFDGLNGHIQNYKDFRGPYFEDTTYYFYNTKTDKIELYSDGGCKDYNKHIKPHQFCFGCDDVDVLERKYFNFQFGDGHEKSMKAIHQFSKKLLQQKFDEFKQGLHKNCELIRKVAETETVTDDELFDAAGIVACKTIPLKIFTNSTLITILLKYLNVQINNYKYLGNVELAMRTLSQLVKELDKSSMELVNICQECGNECDSLKLKMKLKLINLQLQRKL